MPIPITMPRLSDTMQEGTLVKWRVKVGDAVKSGDLLADVETDKATMELQAFDDGTVAKLAVAEGQIAPVGQVILVLAAAGESVEDAAKAAAGDGGAPVPEQPTTAIAEQPVAGGEAAAPPAEEVEEGGEEPAGAAAGGRVRVSPLARKIAEDRGVDLTSVRGTGPGGRIIKRDVLAAGTKGAAAKPQAVPGAALAAKPQAAPGAGAAAAAAPAAKPGAGLAARVVPVSNMRRTIARRLVESKTTIPHFTVTLALNADPLLALRQTLNQQLASQGIKLTVSDFIHRAAALALVQFPMVNASWAEDGIHQYGTVRLGVAVALPAERGGGLVVPVIRDAQLKGLRLLSQEAAALADKARTRGLSVEDMADGTFTISSLGMFGVEHFEAIINPPQAAILAVGAALEQPVARGGQVVLGHEMTLTLSADHRVVDGATAAQFLQALRQGLENPATLLV